MPWRGEWIPPVVAILAWEIPGMGEPGGLQALGHREVDTMEQLTLVFFFSWKQLPPIAL